MGGRGASSRGSTGGTFSKTALGWDGDEIDLSGYPLKYGGKDPHLSGSSREKIEAFEREKVKRKVENALILDKDGNQTYTGRGGKGSVRTPTAAWQEGGVMTHNHPRSDPTDKGMLGGTFSHPDTISFVKNPVKTIRAAATEGTYSMSKTDKFDARGASAHFAKADATFNANLKKTGRELANKYRSKEITYSEYLKQYSNSFNKELVNLHNTYAEGASKYGYTYTLERRS
jgi:hypothetical protein